MTKTRLVILCLVAVVWVFNVPVHGEVDPFHILVTNDDGIESPGIQMLAEKLAAVGQVHVVAPCGQRSGSSMAVALRDELLFKAVEKDGKSIGHCVDTTPAGSALLAISTLAPETGFDLVISGINRGANPGTASHMSGTIGAAMMGAFYEIPAIAVSSGARSGDYDYPARFVVSFVEELKQHPPRPGIVYSINIPGATQADNAGVKVAKMGGIHLSVAYEESGEESDGRRFVPKIGFKREAPKGSDTEAYLQGMISIAPLQFDWTAYSVLEQMQGWDLSHELEESGKDEPE